MTLRALAHSAHQFLQARAGHNARHSHVYELLAAAFGYRTWASLRADALLTDQGVGQDPEATAGPQIAGRALQLQYGQAEALAMADALGQFIANRRLGLVLWAALAPLLSMAPTTADPGGDAEDDEYSDDWGDVPRPSPPALVHPPREHYLASALLLDCLEQAAATDPHAHLMLAALHRCSKPNAYLYEESLKGRQLSASERGWVEDYMRLTPRYQRYEMHLKAAAEAGVRAAALEYGTVFERPEFIALAERLDGEVDPEQMARVATSLEVRARWLRQAAEAGSRRALEDLADLGDPWAEDQMASSASVHWLRATAERALGKGDPVRAWVWQYVALARGDDLTHSTLAARHDGGSNDGEFYDSDFGGPLYVDGDEGLVLPELDGVQHRVAKATARDILRH
ncbi:hypothetical protein [Paracidovorax anthurii]|uniref:Uncharacterized protein n=1 Tax=Paracidovorax anthurii TaxID=78229 RepID=A0A328Z8K6_9BURK|nr:hypothetical protein [Paracidovorax anthurii]RAR81012.1 hypothetical protein AX018_102128 [Paracidovorax anthurii]